MHTWLYLAAPLGPGIEQVIRVVAILFAFVATVAQRRALRRF